MQTVPLGHRRKKAYLSPVCFSSTDIISTAAVSLSYYVHYNKLFALLGRAKGMPNSARDQHHHWLPCACARLVVVCPSSYITSLRELTHAQHKLARRMFFRRLSPIDGAYPFFFRPTLREGGREPIVRSPFAMRFGVAQTAPLYVFVRSRRLVRLLTRVE